MNRQNSGNRSSKPHGFVARLVHLAAIALVISVPSTMHAADNHADRAVKQRVAPTYPELAKRLHVGGVVRIAATVAADGKVSATRTVSGNTMLAGAAEDAVRKWKFETADSESTVEVNVNFALAQ